jgi:quercetin dioxygenase-like cupin family protein
MVIEWEFAGGPWEKPDPPHSHPHEQVTYIVEGVILFFHGEEKCQLSTGDMVSVAPEVPHYIQVLSPKVRLIDTFTPLRREFL